MAWNPSPKVADCREIARKWGHRQVIVIALSADDEKIEMVTYGETKALCSTTWTMRHYWLTPEMSFRR